MLQCGLLRDTTTQKPLGQELPTGGPGSGTLGAGLGLLGLLGLVGLLELVLVGLELVVVHVQDILYGVFGVDNNVLGSSNEEGDADSGIIDEAHSFSFS